MIRNLLDEVRTQATDAHGPIRLGHKVSDLGDGATGVREFRDNEAALAALGSGEVQVLGGTTWLWTDDGTAGLADVLFVDEAGQMSLANVLAVSLAAKNLVLLGDPNSSNSRRKGRTPTVSASRLWSTS